MLSPSWLLLPRMLPITWLLSPLFHHFDYSLIFNFNSNFWLPLTVQEDLLLYYTPHSSCLIDNWSIIFIMTVNIGYYNSRNVLKITFPFLVMPSCFSWNNWLAPLPSCFHVSTLSPFPCSVRSSTQALHFSNTQNNQLISHLIFPS